MDVKAVAWAYGVSAVAAFALAAAFVEGPVSTQFDKNEDALITHRFDAGQQSPVLTEDKVRAIVKEEVKPMLQQQLEEIRRLLPPQKAQSHPGKPVTPR
jgi:hypothetical protein